MRLPKVLHSWSFRLTLLYAGLFTASVLVLFAVTYWSAADFAARDEADEIGVEFRAIVDEAELAGYAQLPRIIDNHLRQRAGARAAYLLQDANGRKIAGNIPEMLPREGIVTVRLMLDKKAAKLHGRGFHLPNGDYLAIAEDSLALRDMKELIASAFGWSVGTTLLLAIGGGGIIGVSVLRRVEAVAQTSRSIIAGDLSQRVPLRGSDDEFDHLSASVNAMLDRIEDLMRSMRQVSNDIAHDLRTPLTRLRQRLELARRHQNSVEDLQAVLDASVAQIDSILATFGALLRIAQIEAGGGITPPSSVDVSALLTAIAEDFVPLAEDNGQTLSAEVQQGLSIAGDSGLLTQMMVNLIENAIRHSPPETQISITAIADGDQTIITVADTGPGIPTAERDNVLRPFYRLEASRTTEGSGLGLSLVSAIAKQHHAKLILEDNAPGLRIAIRFVIDSGV